MQVGAIAVASLAMLSACRQEPKKVRPVRVPTIPTATPVPYFVHRVDDRGQTLGRIARWYTGEFDNWKKLAGKANPDLTQCCAALRIGREIFIPRDLMVRTDPMPKQDPVTRPAKPLQKRPAATPTPKQIEPDAAEPAAAPTSAPAAEPTEAPEPTAAPEATPRPEPTKAPEATKAPEPPAEEDPLDIIGPR